VSTILAHPPAAGAAIDGLAPAGPVDAGAVLAVGDGAPGIVLLAAAELFVDPSYQREPDPRWLLATLKAGFDPALFGALEVSDRGSGVAGRFAVVDGQGRLELAQLAHRDVPAGSLLLPCRIHRGLTVEGEAALYRRLFKGRRPLTGWDIWKARVREGDPTAVEITRIVGDAGWGLARRRAPGAITSYRAAEQLHAAGDTLLAATIAAITAGWACEYVVDRDVLAGVGLVRAAYTDRELSPRRLGAALAERTPVQLATQARRDQVAHRYRRISELVAAAIVDVANDGRGTRPRIEPYLTRATRTTTTRRAQTAPTSTPGPTSPARRQAPVATLAPVPVPADPRTVPANGVGDGDDRLSFAEIAAALLGPPGDWREKALCAQTDPEAFYPEKGGSTAPAKQVCAGCEVRDDCLADALAHDERFGVWGGLSERERRGRAVRAGAVA